jgi:methyl-accepting chemotaxis protein
MQKLTLGRRLGLAFGALIALTCLLGGIAVWRINLAVASATDVSVKRVPEVQAATLVAVMAWETRASMLSWEMVHEDEVLRKGRRTLAILKEHLKAASDLAATHPDLVILKAGEAEASKKAAEYEALVDKIETAWKNLVAQSIMLDDSGSRFEQACEEMRLSQQKQMHVELGEWAAQTSGKGLDEKTAVAQGNEVAEKVGLAALKERLAKIGMVEELMNRGNAIRLNNFKAQNERDTDKLSEVIKGFVSLEATLAALAPLMRQQVDVVQLGKVRECVETYKATMEKMRGSLLATKECSDKMLITGQDVTDNAGEVVDGGMTAIKKAAMDVSDGLFRTNMIVLVGLVVAMIAGGVVAWLSTRAIAGPIREGAQVLVAAAGEVSTTVSQIAASAGETATAVAETSTTIDEVRQTAQLAKESAIGVSDSAQSAAQASRNGLDAMRASADGLKRIGEQVKAITGSVVMLSEKGQAIGDIITTVNDLAEQSNLLAVNASIEAARAGEQGKGFAVVADEIRSLAEQSKEATKQVRSILIDVQKATSAAVLTTEQGGKAVQDGQKLADQAAEAINTLAVAITQSAQAATQIAASSQQQLAGTEQVGNAMQSIKEASLQNQASTTQLATAARNLRDVGLSLQQLLG